MREMSEILTGSQLILRERARQMAEEGWTPEHDDKHASGEIAWAAACYAAPQPIRAKLPTYQPCGCREAMCPHSAFPKFKNEWRDPWPWDSKWDKRSKHTRIRQLVIAGALIAAEIDRLQRS